jgi:hypothetical protein
MRDFDMSIESEFEIAEGWIKEHLPPNNDNNPLNPIKSMKYWEIVDDLVRNNPTSAWNCIIIIANKTENDVVISNLAAGPLEDLISLHGKDYIDLIEKEAQKSDRFRWALVGVWKNASDDAVWARIERLKTAAR